MRYTRTHTSFFSEDDTATLREECERLTKEAESRAPYIDADMRRRLEDRVLLLRIAIAALTEPAD